jgi:predicted RNase H-like HicB family nuclease/predicted XRE-type DNA-binding protein
MAAMSDKTYRVVVTREGDAWLADEPDLEGTHTWAKNLPSLDRNIREAIALAEDLPESFDEGSLDLDYSYDMGDAELNAVTTELRAERERIQREERYLAERTATVAAQLTKRSLSVRDVARLLGVSPQRISQVAPKKATSSDRTADAA